MSDDTSPAVAPLTGNDAIADALARLYAFYQRDNGMTLQAARNMIRIDRKDGTIGIVYPSQGQYNRDPINERDPIKPLHDAIESAIGKPGVLHYYYLPMEGSLAAPDLVVGEVVNHRGLKLAPPYTADTANKLYEALQKGVETAQAQILRNAIDSARGLDLHLEGVPEPYHTNPMDHALAVDEAALSDAVKRANIPMPAPAPAPVAPPAPQAAHIVHEGPLQPGAAMGLGDAY